jgi:hypothetical protein
MPRATHPQARQKEAPRLRTGRTQTLRRQQLTTHHPPQKRWQQQHPQEVGRIMMSSRSLLTAQRARGFLAHKRTMPLAAVLIAALIPVAGCGSSDNGVASKPASQILAATRAAAVSASSVHIVGTSKVRQGPPLKLDASMSKQHAHAQFSAFALSIQTIRDGDTLYVKGNPAFNQRIESTQGVKVPSGKWLRGTSASLGQIGMLTEIDKELPVILGGSGPISKGAKVTIDGQPAITLKLTRKLYTGTLYVATTGQPYPLKLIKTGRETGQTTFSGWDDTTIATTPPANAVDISRLEHIKGH